MRLQKLISFFFFLIIAASVGHAQQKQGIHLLQRDTLQNTLDSLELLNLNRIDSLSAISLQISNAINDSLKSSTSTFNEKIDSFLKTSEESEKYSKRLSVSSYEVKRIDSDYFGEE